MGSEPDPGQYVDALIEVIEECRRVLAPHGSLCLELGDTYAGAQPTVLGKFSEEWAAKYAKRSTVRAEGLIGNHNRTGDAWPLPKSLALIPETVRFTLAYGTNPHTGRTTQPWRIRNVIRWVRPNPPVGALGDKFRPATSEMLVACTSAKRFFDLDAVREPLAESTQGRMQNKGYDITLQRSRSNSDKRKTTGFAPMAGAPPLDWWNIPTHPYKGAHYATFPPDLIIKPIKAMCPERVCVECGEPSRRIVGDPEYVPSASYRGGHMNLSESARVAPGANQFVDNGGKASVIRQAPTLGWSDCGCTNPGGDNWRPGVVLDPFAGTGTVLQVATGHSRNAIGIDLDERNAELALERVGPLMLNIIDTRDKEGAVGFA
jgi:DNA modification methylase